MVGGEKNWLVLRCGSSKTGVLANSLVEHGLNAWTPLWTRKWRDPREGRRKVAERLCLPSFVFICEADTFAALALMDRCKVPRFSLMRSMGRLVRFKDRDLDPMRNLSDNKPAKPEPDIPPINTIQLINAGPFQGLHCKVIGRTNHQAIVELLGQSWFPVKIDPFLLTQDAA